MSPEAYGALGVIITAIVTWAVAVRRLGGTVRSSEAQQLWGESTSIRTWATERMKSLEKENDRLRDNIQDERNKNALANERIAVLESHIKQLLNGDEPPWKA